MNSDQFEGQWHQFKGSLKAQWGKLTDDDIDRIEGNREKLVGKIQSEFERTAILAKNEMKGILHSLHAEDIKVEYLIKEGKPNKVICREATGLKADLIVMGTNGKNSISDYLLGSNAAYVVEHVKIPVLVIPLTDKFYTTS